MKVLVAEDDLDIRALLDLAVSSLGHEVRVASDGHEAWELFQAEGADVIISDWLMPRMEGPELCRRVRESIGTPYVYFVILTALDSEERMLQGMVAGADDYLSKPFSFGALQARLVAAERITILHRQLAQRDAERGLSLARHAAALRIARSFAAAVDPNVLLRELIAEAIRLVDGDAGAVYRWDEASSELVQVARSAGRGGSLALKLGEGSAGRAAQGQHPVVSHDGTAGAEMAVPLWHEGRLLGSLAIWTARPGTTFTREHTESLEMLASVAAAALVGLERAQLLAVTMAARELAHVLNNDLAVPVGALEILRADENLPEPIRQIVEQAGQHLASAAGHVRRLQQVIRIETYETPVGPALDLERSTDRS